MKIKLSETCGVCSQDDRGKIVDAAVNPETGIWPAAIYFSEGGFFWSLSDSDYEIIEEQD